VLLGVGLYFVRITLVRFDEKHATPDLTNPWQVGCPRNKQKKNFGSNRNKPKLNLFRLIFGLFRETNKTFFRFVSVFRIRFETTETNTSVSKQTEKTKKYKTEKQL
jgi:hypothetical protein